MLRKKSKGDIHHNNIMGDYGSLQSPSRTSSSSLFGSPKLLNRTVSKSFISIDSELMTMSPTSILDTTTTKSYSSFINPFWSESNSPRTPKTDNKINRDKLDSRGLVDVLIEKTSDSKIVPDSRKVLFGSQLKIQIPSSVSSPVNSPNTPPEFGTKTRNSHVGPFSPGLSSPSFSKKSPFSSLSAHEMELSEDYTCVISRGPNPKTTHIFDDCIVENCCGVSRFSESRKKRFSVNIPSENFLSFCYSCKKNLGQGEDIYIYRGEKAFCSRDCRYKEMMLEEGIETPEFDDLYGTTP